MKKMRSSIIILFLVGLIAIVPLAGAACSSSSTGSDGPFTWEMQAPYAETDASGIALTKFKELAEDLTDGRITINASYNGTPVAHTSQFAALQSNALDLAVTAAGLQPGS